jgi:hypothetical protein
VRNSGGTNAELPELLGLVTTALVPDPILVNRRRPSDRRLRKYPKRALRPEMLVNVLRDWRLSCDAKLDKGHALLREVRWRTVSCLPSSKRTA